MATATVRRFLRHRVVLKTLVKASAYTGNDYEEKEVWARFHDSSSLIRDPAGREIISGARVTLLENVEVGDLITDLDGRDRKVVQVDTATTTRGKFSHNVAHLA